MPGPKYHIEIPRIVSDMKEADVSLYVDSFRAFCESTAQEMHELLGHVYLTRGRNSNIPTGRERGAQT
jgi:hypothetical protein